MYAANRLVAVFAPNIEPLFGHLGCARPGALGPGTTPIGYMHLQAWVRKPSSVVCFAGSSLVVCTGILIHISVGVKLEVLGLVLSQDER